MTGRGRWSDLGPRIVSAAILAAVALGAVLAGGVPFTLFIALACAIMVWELLRMFEPAGGARALPAAAGAGLLMLLSVVLPHGLWLLPLGALIGGALAPRGRAIIIPYAAAILVAGFAMILLREVSLAMMIWLTLVIVASDVAGYFAGKAIGGAKLWPRVSPNKTWSGTVAGWFGAALVGAGAALVLGGGLALVALSVLVAVAGQAGDIVESAIKRHAGVKDSSTLIPGHGGLLDRFDAMLGGALVLSLAAALAGLPQGLA